MGLRLTFTLVCLLACSAERQTPALSAEASPATPAPARAWVTSLDRDHALVGKVWDVRGRALIEPTLMMQRLAAARFVLLGERHDNPDHHRLQAQLLEGLVSRGRRPAVVLEMLEVEQQAAVDRYRARGDATAAGFGAALGWEKTSWPPFRDYQAIFEQAFAAELPIVAGNVSHATARALVKQGLSALPPERVSELALDRPFPPALEQTLLDELRASHCGKLPESLLAPMALAQHARDAQLARSLLGAARADGAVLIAGAGHARRDRGVPYYLALWAPNGSVASVALHEVQPGVAAAESYVGPTAAFDYLWFTPRVSDEDPCAAFQKKAN